MTTPTETADSAPPGDATPTPRTVDQALERFQLIDGPGDRETTACVMTAISWVAGESWSDHPACAHPILANLAIRANDHGDTTAEQRADIVRAGATGLIDTWWIPGEVIVWCVGQGMAAEGMVGRCLATLAAVTDWKNTRSRPVLSGAVLRGAVLSDADLCDADLCDADLRDADLSGADLSGADLSGADLRSADLRSAVLSGAVLCDAVLRGAVGVEFALCDHYTVPPAGWTVDRSTWRLVKGGA